MMKFEEIVEFGRTDDVKTTREFASLMLSQCSLQALTKNGFLSPSPVQVQAIPIGLLGFDVVVQAKSGTGKTLVFSLLALEGLNAQANYPQVLILAPTREIALQICSVITRLAARVVRIGAFVGGDKPIREDIIVLKKGVHIVVGTSGRLCHLVSIKALKIDRIRLFVLDEADKLMDENFKNDINYLFSFLPIEKQVAVFSATYPHNIDAILSRYMRSPRLVRAGTDVQLIGIKQYVVLRYSKSALETLVTLLKTITFSQCIIYGNDQKKCQKIYEYLLGMEFDVALISSAVEQNDRNRIIKLLKSFSVKMLVSTDLTARGIDAENVNVVINMGVPADCETYLHRIGRAGRFGGYGAAFTILDSCKEVRKFNVLVKEGNLHLRLLYIEDTFPSNLCQNEAYYNSCAEFVADKREKIPYESGGRNYGENDTLDEELYRVDKDDIVQKTSDIITFSDYESEKNAKLFDTMRNTIDTERDILHELSTPKNHTEKNAGIKSSTSPEIESEGRRRYSKEELTNIRDSHRPTYWSNYALNRFDFKLFTAPFVSKALLKLVKDGSQRKFIAESQSDSLDESICSNSCKFTTPAKGSFQRTTAKRNVDSKSGLIQIFHSRTDAELHKLVTTSCDLSRKPIIFPRANDIDLAEERGKTNENGDQNDGENDTLDEKVYGIDRDDIVRKTSDITLLSGYESEKNAKLFDTMRNTTDTERDILHELSTPKNHTERNAGIKSSTSPKIESGGRRRYSKEELTNIRDSHRPTYWSNYAVNRFDFKLFTAPFVSKALLKLVKDGSQRKFIAESQSDSLDESKCSNSCKFTAPRKKTAKWRFQRTTAKRNVDSKSGLMQIFHSKTDEELQELATNSFDLSRDPFISPHANDTDLVQSRRKLSEESYSNNLEKPNLSTDFETKIEQKNSKMAKFKFQRTTAKRNVYTKSGLMQIFHSKTTDQWRNIATACFDVSKEPFVAPSVRDTNLAATNETVALSSAVPQLKIKKDKERYQDDTVSDDFFRYSRDTLLTIRDRRIGLEWELWAKSRFNVNMEPFQLDHELRVPVPMQLRVLREREKAMRKNVKNGQPHNGGDLRACNQVIASSRFPYVIEPIPNNIDEYKSRVLHELSNKTQKFDVHEHFGPVVTVRHTPQGFKKIVRFCADCLEKRRMDFLELIFSDSCIFPDATTNEEDNVTRAVRSTGTQTDSLKLHKMGYVFYKHRPSSAISNEMHVTTSEDYSGSGSEQESDLLSELSVSKISPHEMPSKNSESVCSSNRGFFKYSSYRQSAFRKSLFDEYLRTINGCLRSYQNKTLLPE